MHPKCKILCRARSNCVFLQYCEAISEYSLSLFWLCDPFFFLKAIAIWLCTNSYFAICVHQYYLWRLQIHVDIHNDNDLKGNNMCIVHQGVIKQFPIGEIYYLYDRYGLSQMVCFVSLFFYVMENINLLKQRFGYLHNDFFMYL